MSLCSKHVEIVNEKGMHARTASLFVQCAKIPANQVTVEDGNKVDGGSVLGLLTLSASKGLDFNHSGGRGARIPWPRWSR